MEGRKDLQEESEPEVQSNKNRHTKFRGKSEIFLTGREVRIRGRRQVGRHSSTGARVNSPACSGMLGAG